MKKFYPLAFLFTMLASSLFNSLQAQPNLIRGPYLQSPGPTSIIIHWRTDIATESRVQYGLADAPAMNTYTDNGNVTTEHIVKLTGLSPHTKYKYAVGVAGQPLASDTRMYFTTAPDLLTPTAGPLWAIGDFGHGNDAEAAVRNAYINYTGNHPADLQLWLGDNAYSDGTDDEFTTKVFDSIHGFRNVMMNLPFASSSGNHDYNSICAWQPSFCNIDPNLHTGPYLNLIDPPTQGELGGVPSGKKIYYSFDYGDIHFVVLNSELGSQNPATNWIGMFNSDSTFTSPMLDWLKADLAATTKKWKVALWHQCPYSGQNQLTDNGLQPFCIATRVHFNPILEKYGIDLVLTGHDHNYQRSYLINGHYGYKTSFTASMMVNGTSGSETLNEPYVKYTDGPLAGKGAVYVVSGNGSEGNDESPIDHPAIYWGEACNTCFGSMIIDIDGDRLDAKYLTAEGTIKDQFTILKRSWYSTGVPGTKNDLENISVYPNPFSSQVQIGYNLLKKNPVSIDVIDAAGKVVYNRAEEILEPGRYTNTLDLLTAGLAAGNYIIRLNCGGQAQYEKVVKMQ